VSGQRNAAKHAKRIVVKVGSSVLTDDGHVRTRAFSELARQISTLAEDGRKVVLVSSGAIALGSRTLGWARPGASIPEMQAAAAVGQIDLVETYRKRFAQHGIAVAQILLTRVGLDDRERFLNARNTLDALLRMGVVPIVNENDTVATDEIRFGDNDNLSATVVNLVDADLLVLLTDVDGLYTEKPVAGERQPELFDVVDEIDAAVLEAAGGSDRAFGRGGMITKLEAARTAGRAGAATVVCNGRTKDVLLRVARGDREGTLFSSGARLKGRKHWIAYTTRARGRLVLDAGAARALRHNGRSLLPAGIADVVGSFGVGDPVACSDEDGVELARGLCAYTSDEVRRIKGLATREIASVLGYSNGNAVIHRDDLVLLDSPSSAKRAPR
jgi:glutamate 5-kinase